MNAMIDVETLRLNKPWLAPLMQVGVVIFDKKGYPIDRLSLFLDQDKLPEWASPEKETVQFWCGMPSLYNYMRAHCMKGLTPEHAMERLRDFLKYHNVNYFWFAGPQFDQIVLEAYLDHTGVGKPWLYNRVKDFRTIHKQFPVDVRREGVLHDAVDDCEHQVKMLHHIALKYGLEWS